MENVSEMRLRKRGPPPFLLKIYQLVEDPNLNELISWGPNNQSFIIWDQFKFSSTILPEYFTHNNFSSFIYQLNSYGFRKINPDRWEYANTWFRAGENELLCKIERRAPKSRKNKQNDVKELPSPNQKKLRLMECEIEYLKNEHKQLEIEAFELRKNQNSINHEMENIKSKEENEMNSLVLKAFVESLSKMGNINDISRELEEPNGEILLQDDGVIGHKDEVEGELTYSQLKFIIDSKELDTEQAI